MAKRRFGKLYSKYDEVVDSTAVCYRRYQERYKCTVCYSPGPAWEERMAAIDIELIEEPKGCTVLVNRFAQYIIRDELYNVLVPYLGGGVVASVKMCAAGESRSTPYVSYRVPRASNWRPTAAATAAMFSAKGTAVALATRLLGPAAQS